MAKRTTTSVTIHPKKMKKKRRPTTSYKKEEKQPTKFIRHFTTKDLDKINRTAESQKWSGNFILIIRNELNRRRVRKTKKLSPA